ncbi:MAG TPA: tetratricopeptide repeat protein [Acidobacteriaceae bacterium]|jgi:tol-pal system protein YbgF
MRKSLFTAAAVLLLSVTALPPRAHAVAKEIIELQTQVSQLQDLISQMKQSNDERMGVLLHMVQQNVDSISRMTTQVNSMQQAMSSQNENQQLSGQMQALNDSVDELKTRIGKLDATLQSMQAQLQNVQNPPANGPMQPAGPAPTGPGGMAQNPPPAANLAPPPPAGNGNPPAPPLQQTYQAALRDYNSARYDLSNSEFSDVIKYYPQDDLAGNAHFYMGEIAYRQGKYPQAVKQYDAVLEQFAGNPKAPAAQLRKGESLLQSQQRDAGAQELRSLIQRYPQTPEAAEARSKLNGMGIRITPKPTAYRQ